RSQLWISKSREACQQLSSQATNSFSTRVSSEGVAAQLQYLVCNYPQFRGRFMRVPKILLCLLTISVFAFLVVGAAAQSLVSGDITGVVSDPSGAVIPNATVTLKNAGTGQTQSTTTNPSGGYRFSLLSPGQYTVTVNASGFQNAERTVTV